MELRDIEYFTVIAEHAHLGRAAEALGLSIPAVSKSLRRLEAATNTKLVTRTPKGIALTAEGHALLSHARSLRVSVRDITRQLADLRNGRAGEVRIGAGPGPVEYLLPSAMRMMNEDGSRVTISVTVASKELMLPALEQGDLELVMTEPPVPANRGFIQEHLYDTTRCVLAARDHPLAGRAEVSLKDLVNERWAVTSQIQQAQLGALFERKGLAAPEIGFMTNSVTLRERAIAQTRLLGLHSHPTYPEARVGMVVLPVRDLDWKRSVCVVYREAVALTPAARRVVETLKAVAARPPSPHTKSA